MKLQRGQILLITIMIVATLLTVVLAVTFKSTTETQLTKLEEDSQKALAAAEAGVEAALQLNKNQSIAIGTLPNFSGSGFTGDATVSAVAGEEFVSPLLQKDQQYTFYLSEYPGFTNPLLNTPLQVYFKTESDCPSLELTLITTSNAITRQITDPCNKLNSSTPDLAAVSGSYPLEGYNFEYQTNAITTNGHAVMIVRTLFAASRIGISTANGTNLPVQGKYVVSEAKSPSGVSKKVQLFQSYPQLPAEFFVTSF